MLLLAAVRLLWHRARLAMWMVPRVDGWRAAAGVALRSECSTFVLSAFGLDVWSDAAGAREGGVFVARAHAVRRLMAFLASEAVCRVSVRHGRDEDVVVGTMGACVTLGCQDWVETPARFAAPTDWSGECAGEAPAAGHSAMMNVVLRVSEDGRADVWVRVNHIASDGVPIQAMLSRLERAWGFSERTIFPTAEEFAPFAMVRPLADRSGFGEVQSFVDFAALLEWRKRRNAALSQPMTLAAAILCRLASHPEFGSVFMGSTVEVPATAGLAAGVGVVVVRPPADPDLPGALEQYARDFNEQVERTRARGSGACRTLDAAALLPPRVRSALLAHALENSPRSFGEMALTMLKDARVFGVPIALHGHARGFIAIGDVSLPTAGGGSVGCVTIKGPVKSLPSMLAAFQVAMSGA